VRVRGESAGERAGTPGTDERNAGQRAIEQEPKTENRKLKTGGAKRPRTNPHTRTKLS